MVEKCGINDMGNRFEDITGMKFNHLKVVELYGRKVLKNNKRQALWKCECDCEKHNIVLTTGYNLKSGKIHCCEECRRSEYPKNRLSRTRIGKIWRGIKNRCYNASETGYERYGGRGIKVCDEWKDEKEGLQNFYDWSMENGYEDFLTIDRIDTDGNYEPLNCRWADKLTQANNRRNTSYAEYKGQKIALCDLARELGISENTLQTRYQRGDRGDRLTRTVRRYKGKCVQ